jgi:hypothetical protein
MGGGCQLLVERMKPVVRFGPGIFISIGHFRPRTLPMFSRKHNSESFYTITGD